MLENLFISLLGISVITSVAILLLKLSSENLNKAYAAKWKYWIWLILALRLIIPFNFPIFSSPVTVDIPDTPVTAFVNTAPAPQNFNSALPIPKEQDIETASISLPQTYPLTLVNVLISLWVIGGVLFLAYQFSGYLLFKKKALRWSKKPAGVRISNLLNAIAIEMGLKKKITVLISKGISSPLMMGFIKPLLFLPNEDYCDTDLNFILRHELTHYKRHDLWYKLFLIVVNAIHWFNPFVYLLFREASVDLELSCDDKVISNLSNDERRSYSETILASITAQKALNTPLTTYFHGGQKTMKNRFINIFNTGKKRNGMVILLAVILAVGALGGVIACDADISENKLLTSLGYTKANLTNIFDHRTIFTPNNEHIAQIVKSLPLQSYREYDSFSLQMEPSKEISVVYNFNDYYDRGGNGLDPFPGVVEENNALLLFAAIEGLERINFMHYDRAELNYTDTYTIEDLIPRFGKLNPSDMKFQDLYQALALNIQLSEFYFGHYSRIYLGVEQENVSYRNGEPHEIRPQPDGSLVWIYSDFSKIYSLSPDGPNNVPENRAFYYFNSAAAEKNDNLTGLYATRFIHDENNGKTYQDITGVLGLPSIIKDMGKGKKYIAYALAEGQKKNAYFILHRDQVVEEGVMYGNDYTILDFE